MRFPNDTHRHVILGKTGTGKTQAGLYALSRRSYDKMPWIIIDYKLEPKFGKIRGLEEIDVRKAPPKTRGLYVVRPLPHQEDEISDFMWKVWKQEKTGLLLDEAYMVGAHNQAMRALLTQGRSKHIPMIIHSQRPSWISPFIMSESDFIQTFFLHFPADIKRVREFVPGATPLTLPDYHSFYFDVSTRQLVFLGPVPSEDDILSRFADRRPSKPYIL